MKNKYTIHLLLMLLLCLNFVVPATTPVMEDITPFAVDGNLDDDLPTKPFDHFFKQ